jgi:WS/DGAT/MGAT family acyltransferase
VARAEERRVAAAPHDARGATTYRRAHAATASGAEVSAQPLNPLDASWLLVESRDTPMHVGGLITFSLPAAAPADFLRSLLADFRACRDLAPPWNQRLRRPGLKGLLPAWEEETNIDLEHHVRLSALPRPGGERELGQVIARLHSQSLDLKRPPWECELIEGLEGGRFAIYIKMHHSLIDGISGMKLLVRSMATDAAASRKLPPFWSMGIPERARGTRESPAPTATQVIESVFGAVRGQLGTLPDVARAFGSMFGIGRGDDEALALPFDTPMSIINHRINGPRRFATQQFALERLKKVAAASDATLNDVVLALCGAALRRFLDELGELPEKSLTAGIPVSVRPQDDEGAGNAITFIIATLGTDLDDARERLAAISSSTRRAKAHVSALPKKAMMQYTLMLMAPYTLSLLSGMGGRTRPMFNVTISNVPGPDKPLYFRGARMEAAYPVSLVSHGQALNITCQSYAGTLAFGFTGCRDSLPHMQRIATYTGEALTELEQALFGTPRKQTRKGRAAAQPTADDPPPRKRAAPKKAAMRNTAAGKRKPLR